MIAIALALLAAAPAPAEATPGIVLQLPLPQELAVTGSFGEYRTGHLHAGLDFSTHGELGWPVRAAADGEVFRLKVEARGYGKAIYVRHPGGWVTVYGHLHSFDDGALGLERIAAASGVRFPGDIYLERPVAVKVGQVLGRSGENGGGPAHLHFELRQDDEPVDPIRYGGIQARGSAAPVLEAIWVLPRGATRIDGGFRPVRHDLVPAGAGRYRLPTTPRVEGPFDLELTAQVPGAGRMGLSRLELVCGGRTLYHADLHRFSFDQYRQSGLVYDPSRTGLPSALYTYRLRAAPGMDVPGIEGAWLRPPEEGTLQCSLTAEDAAGHAAAAAFTLQVGPSPGYAPALPAVVDRHEMHEGLLLLNDDVPIDPRNLPPGATTVPGMPRIVLPGRQAVTVRPAPGLEIRFPEDATYGPGAVAMAADRSAGSPPTGLEMIVPPVRLEPADLFLRTGAVWRAQVPDPSRAALYAWDDATKRWGAVGKTVGEGWIEETTRRGGTYAVLRDVSSPRITSVQLREERRLGARRLVFPVEEIGEGIDVEAFEATLDGEPIVAEYDPDRRWGEIWLPSGISGRRAVTAICIDRAGNRSERFRATVSL